MNSAFIALSMEMLSPPAEAHTVHLLQLIATGQGASPTPEALAPPPFTRSSFALPVNCLFAASLSCSLITASGAVVAKQWLMHYSRGGIGSLDVRGRRRQRKWTGVERYYLQVMIELLPVLLLVSLWIFFVGFVLFIADVDWTVGWVIFGIMAVGLAVHLITTAFAIYDKACPFQTPVSYVSRRIISLGTHAISFWWSRTRGTLRGWWRDWAFRMRQSTTSWGLFHPLVVSAGIAFGPHTRQVLLGIDDKVKTHVLKFPPKTEDPRVDAHSVCWYIQRSADEKMVAIAARIIPQFFVVDRTALVPGKAAFNRLFSVFKHGLDSLDGVASDRSASVIARTVVFGRALGHVILLTHGMNKRRHRQWFSSSHLRWPSWHIGETQGSNELVLLKFCIYGEVPTNFCTHNSNSFTTSHHYMAPLYLAALLQPDPENGAFRIIAQKLDRIILVQWLITICLSSGEVSATAINLCSWALAVLPQCMDGLSPGTVADWMGSLSSQKRIGSRTAFNDQLLHEWRDVYTR